MLSFFQFQMFISFLIVLIVLITESICVIPKLKNVPLPLIAVGLNRHRDEYKTSLKTGLRAIPTRAVSSESRTVNFRSDSVYMGSDITDDEYIRYIINTSAGLP